MSIGYSEVLDLVRSGVITIDAEAIERGEVRRNDGVLCSWSVEVGENLLRSAACDQFWTEFKLELFAEVDNIADPVERQTLMDQIRKEEHSHWNWLHKTLRCQLAEHSYFHLVVDDMPQAACITYHPKASQLQPQEIFYIEYIEVAPWNRKYSLRPRLFAGVGSILIRAIQRYFVERIGLSTGFCLHSLPQSKPYYQSIGMVPIETVDKPPLAYFEMPIEKVDGFLSGS